MLKKICGTKKSSYLCSPNAEIAQLVEHDLAKVGVASSSLVFRSKQKQQPEGCCFCFGGRGSKERPRSPPLESRFPLLSHSPGLYSSSEGICFSDRLAPLDPSQSPWALGPSLNSRGWQTDHSFFGRDRIVVVLWILSGRLFRGFSSFYGRDRITDSLRDPVASKE